MNQYFWEKSNPDTMIEEVTEDPLFLIESACSVSKNKATLHLTASGHELSCFQNCLLTPPRQKNLVFQKTLYVIQDAIIFNFKNINMCMHLRNQ